MISFQIKFSHERSREEKYEQQCRCRDGENIQANNRFFFPPRSLSFFSFSPAPPAARRRSAVIVAMSEDRGS